MAYTKARSLKGPNSAVRGSKVPKAEFDVAAMEFRFHFHPEAYGTLAESVYPLTNRLGEGEFHHLWATWNVTKEDLVLIRDTINSALEWL